jgi:hypothetical protein
MKIFCGILTLFIISASYAQIESLPAPIVNNKSFEILSNNRYSVHSGFSGSLSNQVLSNALWAMNRMPQIGSYREIYVATPANVYRYDTTNHTLVLHLAGNHRYSTGSAFEIGIASDRHEETGLMIQAGLLASNAFRDWNAGSNVATCPMKYAANYANSNWNPSHTIECVNVFGRYNMSALDTTCLAVSSNLSLPLPRTNNSDTFETVLSRLSVDSIFNPNNLSLQMISQLSWAGYGVTPHMTTNNRRGLTVPSAVAAYYLTRKIYIVRDVGVHRYNNRQPPGTSLSTADHRLEQVTSEDRRAQLRSASPRIPSTTPVYFVICVSDTASYGPMQEAGFVAFQYMMQAEILGLNYFLTVPLSRTERSAIISALSLPSSDIPVIVFSCGEPVGSGINDLPNNFYHNDRLHVTMLKNKVQIEYWLNNNSTPQVAIYDLSGRLVYSFDRQFHNTGHYTVEWNKKDNNNHPVSAGTYICQLNSQGKITSTQFIIAR